MIKRLFSFASMALALLGAFTLVFAFNACSNPSGGGDTGEGAGTVLNVATASQWESALTTIRNGGNGKTYTITVSGTITAPGFWDYNTKGFGGAQNLNVTLNGSGTVTIDSTTNGALLWVRTEQTLIINGPTLTGHANNGNAVIEVDRGTLELKSGTITGNYNSNASGGGGVRVTAGGSFTMSGGTISNNEAWNSGGGVYVAYSTFTMSGGTISNNRGRYGGGINVSAANIYSDPAHFTMTGGTISGNTGSGVYTNNCVILMKNGTITGNSDSGVNCISKGSFTMENGIISGNTTTGSTSRGGGVYINSDTSFSKEGGIIYGIGEGDNSNTALASTNPGHAVYWSSTPARYRDTTLNTNQPLKTADPNTGWNQ